MVKEGALKNPNVDVIFGMHINSQTDIGTIKYKPEGILAAAQRFEIHVHGKQSHGSTPWASIDPIVISAQIINGLQMIISRETELTQAGAVITVGMIKGGIRNNIIPEEVTMVGTIRTLDYNMQKKLNETMIKRTKAIAESYGATADITIAAGIPITYNDPALTAEMLPSLQKAVGKDHVILIKAITGAEDFSFYQKEIPGVYFFVGAKPLNVRPQDAPSHHTPDFYIDESGMKTGVKAMVNLTIDYMNNHSK